MESENQAIRALHTAWIDAVNAGDLERLLSLMTDDAVFLTPGQAPAGRGDFPGNFAAAHQAFQIRCVSELQEVAVAGDVAFTVCKDSLALRPHTGGGTSAFTGHRLTVYRRAADRRWRLARDAHTLSPVAG